MRNLVFVFTFLILVSVLFGHAQDQPSKSEPSDGFNVFVDQMRNYNPLDVTPLDYEVLGSSELKQVNLNGELFDYRLTVDKIGIVDALAVLPDADIVSFSYSADVENQNIERPVVFAFNGGPGSASIWLHAGAWGPIRFERNGGPTEFSEAPYEFEPNPGFLIDVADLVFVDPVNTGLSKSRDLKDVQEFSSLRRDARANCIFVGNWLKSRGNSNREVYFAGESYGSLRVAAMAAHPICRRQKLNIRGLVFVSGLMDMHARASKSDRYIEDFPTIAAARWFHRHVDRTKHEGNFSKYLDDARSVAIDTIGVAMIRSAFAMKEETDAKLREACTFIDAEPKDPQVCFSKYTLGEPILFDASKSDQLNDVEATLQCAYDARFTCGPKNKGFGYPGGLDKLGKELVAHLRPYITQETGFDIGPTYKWKGPRASTVNWDMGFWGVNRGAGTNMAQVLSSIPYLEAQTTDGRGPIKLLSVSGYYDLVTPFFGIERAFKDARLTVKQINYEAGHMMYFDRDIGAQLANDVREFIK